ncbi:phosphatase PAP2 family protein [Alteromonas lipotrueiana]|uniref:phosphatase PAP2 family protein n=1 Tax=Alteromonas lipotrueiana TaxID=2803815 RepID=UPI001C43D467|nr:phosphatase PAP2 family protein [Alteromonas lipotrueiana]
MANLLGKKGLAAYKAYDIFKSKKKPNGFLASETLSAVTKPPAVVALAASAYAASRFSDSKTVQNTLLRATLSSALAGAINAGLKRIIGRQRPRADSGSTFDCFSLKDSHNSMPSGHAAAITAVAASLPKSYGPILAAGAATAIIGHSRTQRDAHHFSDVLVGGGVGFASAYLVSKLLKPAAKRTSTDTTVQQYAKGETYQGEDENSADTDNPQTNTNKSSADKNSQDDTGAKTSSGPKTNKTSK